LDPQFSVDPSFCPTSPITSEVIGGGITVPFNPTDQELTIPENTNDLSPSNPNDDGSTEEPYEVVTTFTVTPLTGAPIVETVTTTITQKNPCVSTTYVNINKPPLDRLAYTVFEDPEVYAAHPEFTVSTVPIDHDLCGEVVYKAQYDAVDIVPTDPLQYDPVTRIFTADSDDPAIIDTIVDY
jgi:hypothetical protein